MQGKVLEVKKILEGVLLGKDIEIIDFNLHGYGQRSVLQVLVDKKGGITLNECADLNRELSIALDERGIFTEHYTLEVSSPGIDRALKTEKDFKWAIGKAVKIFTKFPMNKKQEFAGEVLDSENNEVKIKTKDGLFLAIKIDDIKKAKLEIRW